MDTQIDNILDPPRTPRTARIRQMYEDAASGNPRIDFILGTAESRYKKMMAEPFLEIGF
jgi:hypothetical protein